MNLLINKHCRDYSRDESALGITAIESLRELVPEWQYCADQNQLTRVFGFKNYRQTMEFVNRVAEIATQEDHHPLMLVSYRQCKVSYNTHTVNGITENDFICAAKIDRLPV